MKRARGYRVGLLAVPVAVAMAAFLAPAGASPITVFAGNLLIKIDGSSAPRVLPKDRTAPISFHGSASLSTRDGTHIPPVLSTELLVDRHIELDTAGLPTCTAAELQARSPDQAMKACGGALLGKGTSTAQVQFPEQQAFEAKGPLLAFNGPASGAYRGSGYNEQLYYVYADVPVPTALIAVGKVSKATGKYGYRISISIPKIAGGAGSFQSAKFTIGRKWIHDGEKHSFLNAECPDGHLDARVEVSFGDGSSLKGDVIDPCRAAR